METSADLANPQQEAKESVAKVITSATKRPSDVNTVSIRQQSINAQKKKNRATKRVTKAPITGTTAT